MKRISPVRAGYTMLEVMIVTAIMSSVMAASFSIITSSQKVQTRSINDGHMHEQARIIAERIAREMRYTGGSCPNYDVSEDAGVLTVSFRKCTGYDTQLQLPTWGNLISYEFKSVPDSGEIDISDGIDNNGNGIIDEGGLYRLEEGCKERLICRDLEAAQFMIQRTGNIIGIRIGLARPDSTVRGALLRGIYETSVVMRN